jgi:hypothetical protein
MSDTGAMANRSILVCCVPVATGTQPAVDATEQLLEQP